MTKKNQSKHSTRSKRKGSLEETISYAMYSDDPDKYTVYYRDKDLIKEANLKEFMESEYFSPIPITRVTKLTRESRGTVWKKGQKELLVK